MTRLGSSRSLSDRVRTIKSSEWTGYEHQEQRLTRSLTDLDDSDRVTHWSRGSRHNRGQKKQWLDFSFRLKKGHEWTGAKNGRKILVTFLVGLFFFWIFKIYEKRHLKMSLKLFLGLFIQMELSWKPELIYNLLICDQLQKSLIFTVLPCTMIKTLKKF